GAEPVVERTGHEATVRQLDRVALPDSRVAHAHVALGVLAVERADVDVQVGVIQPRALAALLLRREPLAPDDTGDVAVAPGVAAPSPARTRAYDEPSVSLETSANCDAASRHTFAAGSSWPEGPTAISRSRRSSGIGMGLRIQPPAPIVRRR